MSRIDPWHSIRPGDRVYHNSTSCVEGMKIHGDDLWPGTGGWSLCTICAALEEQLRANRAKHASRPIDQPRAIANTAA
jgi:hypothetical protein